MQPSSPESWDQRAARMSPSTLDRIARVLSALVVAAGVTPLVGAAAAVLAIAVDAIWLTWVIAIASAIVICLAAVESERVAGLSNDDWSAMFPVWMSLIVLAGLARGCVWLVRDGAQSTDTAFWVVFAMLMIMVAAISTLWWFVIKEHLSGSANRRSRQLLTTASDLTAAITYCRKMGWTMQADRLEASRQKPNGNRPAMAAEHPVVDETWEQRFARQAAQRAAQRDIT